MLKSKIHRATVTETELNYGGSLTLSPELMQAADMLENERVQVLNFNTGARFETYIMRGAEGSSTVCLNGPAARLGQVGDQILVLSYVMVEEEEAGNFKSVIVYVDKNNKVVEVKKHGGEPEQGEFSRTLGRENREA